jgi:hypothetical protein
MCVGWEVVEAYVEKKDVYQLFSASFGHGLVALMANGVTVRGHVGCGWCHELVGHHFLPHDMYIVWNEGLWMMRSGKPTFQPFSSFFGQFPHI